MAAEWGVGQVLWVLIWLSLFIIYARLVVSTFVLIVRAEYLSGWGKALWTLAIIALPFIGVIAFLVVNGGRLNPPRASEAVDLPPPPAVHG